MTMTTLLRKPSAWLPMLVSLVALALVLDYLVRYGVAPQEDEGAHARIFQLLIVVEAILIGSFGFRWIPETPRAAIAVIALQLPVAAVPLGLVFALEW